MHDVVGVHDEYPLGGGEFDCAVEGEGRACVGLAEDLDARIGLGERLGDGERSVGGTVVEDDEFEVSPGLTEHAGDGVVEEGLSVVGGHYDRNSHSLSAGPLTALEDCRARGWRRGLHRRVMFDSVEVELRDGGGPK